ncbi:MULTISPECIES: AmpG family muropeptide MFS transporter [Acinetobacter]|uniref:AmpG family muropeptide MFS transporter n=1 Tax=Acinetobacter TaxID=469 RepID=UPI0022762DA8|nr:MULTISPECIES: MFS transporter [Acinetobacter]MDS7929885.1 MFS transporter [Acinetobacter sp. V102_4]GLG83963.1 MFS transporter [Acinetobacter calcoaceticus]
MENKKRMSAESKGWKSSFMAFLDRRAIIMLFLGFSSGIPIFLIFSTLSFWLTEAGINRSTITMFSWAALAYSFKFIWAPLIDKLPLPYLTKKMGLRRSWLLVAQLLVICAICMMAFTNPLPNSSDFGSFSNLTIMAGAAIFLGFSSATQDIIVDAYRIELTEDPNIQTVLASTYNAGYRTATIITQLGALLFAASLGTAVGNYIYEAWRTTYLLMAGLMSIGIITTLLIHEPQVKRVQHHYQTKDYFQLFSVFVISTIVFATSFYQIGLIFDSFSIQDAFLSFIILVIKFLVSILIAVVAILALIKFGLINKTIVVETWLSPLLDFFKRYGVKVALAILLLIGFYRISDVVAGVMANLFYLDLNFDKEEIAWFNKFFAIFFVILGGFLGGMLAQRYNVMKMMLLGAILASTTNLIFVGLVKSGATMQNVQVNIGDQVYTVNPDEVGNWSLQFPSNTLTTQNEVSITSQPIGYTEPLKISVPLKLFNSGSQPDIYIQAIGGDNLLYKDELKKDVILHGNLLNLPKNSQIKSVSILLNSKNRIEGKIKDNDWNVVIPGNELAKLDQIRVEASYEANKQLHNLSLIHSYKKQLAENQPRYRMSLFDIPAIPVDKNIDIELKGKVVVPYSKVWLVMGIIFDNLASGLAGAVFIAFLSSLTSVSFTAMQYAIFSSLMLLLPKTIGGYSGTIVNHIGYSGFFTVTFLMGLPILLLVIWVGKLLSQRSSE